MGDITLLLEQWRDGDRSAERELFSLVTPKLRKLAHYLMKGERKGHSLEATDLVNQIYIKLVAGRDRDWQSLGHFFPLAARAMRRYLIDHASGRPDAEFVAIEGMEDLLPSDAAKVELALTVDKLLNELAESNPELCQLVELKYFLGLTNEEAADAVGIHVRTMQRRWRDGRRWLFEHDAETGASSGSKDAGNSAGR